MRKLKQIGDKWIKLNKLKIKSEKLKIEEIDILYQKLETRAHNQKLASFPLLASIYVAKVSLCDA